MSPTGRSPSHRDSGFTLLELAIVLVILTLFFSVISINIEPVFSGGDLRGASRIIIGEIGRLRGKAVYTHRKQELRFKIGENIFYPLESYAEGEIEAGWSTRDIEKEPETRKLPEGVKFEDVVVMSKGKIQEGEASIGFHPNGTVEPSLIHIRNEKDDTHTLQVNPLTGQVRVYDTYIEQRFEE